MPNGVSSLVVVLAGCTLCFGCATTSEEGNLWQKRVSQVGIGMRREEVEKLLPPHPDSPVVRAPLSGRQATIYWVAPRWHVSIGYNAASQASDDRVVWGPTLSRKRMPGSSETGPQPVQPR